MAEEIESKFEFTPQNSVEWYSVSQLSKTGLKAVISSIFGSFQDKREMQSALQKADAKPYYDLSQKQELWIDFVADLGDGFDATYSVAHTLARESLAFEGKETYLTQRGNVLLMGGDQVYPTASREEYQNRLKGPYHTALPDIEEEDDEKEEIRIMEKRPLLFAIPGNHDWYDGLTNFLKIFCQKRKIGRWKTVQDRSYFAIKLSEKLWLFGIDVQLDADIDTNQLQYFNRVLDDVAPESKVILCTAEPAWVFTSRRKDHSFKNLSYFERHCSKFNKKNLKQVLTLAGDLHHYSRYTDYHNPEIHRITSGGGGAFLHPTHNLPDVLDKMEGVVFEKKCVFPSEADSKKIVWENLFFGIKNWGFARFLGLVYVLLGWLSYSFAHKFAAPDPALVDKNNSIGMAFYHLLINPLPLFLAILLISCLCLFTDTNPFNYKLTSKRGQYKFMAWGIVHGILHLLLIITTYRLIFHWVNKLGLHIWGELPLTLAALFMGGAVLGSTLFGVYLLVSNRYFGIHDNEAFSALKHQGFKNFIRLHITPENITLYPIGIRETSKWQKVGNVFKASTKLPQPELIEEPIRISLMPVSKHSKTVSPTNV